MPVFLSIISVSMQMDFFKRIVCRLKAEEAASRGEMGNFKSNFMARVQ